MILRCRYFNCTHSDHEVEEIPVNDGKVYSFKDLREFRAQLHDHNCAVTNIEIIEEDKHGNA